MCSVTLSVSHFLVSGIFTWGNQNAYTLAASTSFALDLYSRVVLNRRMFTTTLRRHQID